MKVIFQQSFKRDIKKIQDRPLLQKLKQQIQEIEAIDNLTKIKNLKKIQGVNSYYRVRLGNYRLGIKVENESVYLIRFLHRREMYRYFP